MSEPIPHDLHLDQLTDEPNLAAVLYAERNGHTRRQYNGTPTWTPDAYPPITDAQATANRARLLANIASTR